MVTYFCSWLTSTVVRIMKPVLSFRSLVMWNWIIKSSPGKHIMEQKTTAISHLTIPRQRRCSVLCTISDNLPKNALIQFVHPQSSINYAATPLSFPYSQQMKYSFYANHSKQPRDEACYSSIYISQVTTNGIQTSSDVGIYITDVYIFLRRTLLCTSAVLC